MHPLKTLKQKVTYLPRGGILINTSVGYIQFGAPPETIKDTMALPLSVPHIFVLPKQLFNWDKGISLAELEFPIYFNFFIKHKKTHVICNEEQAKQLIKVLQESVFGPKQLDLSTDFHQFGEDIVIPDLRAELNYYKNFTLKDLISPEYFENNTYKIENITISINNRNNFFLYEDDKKIAEIPGIIEYSPKFIIGERLPEPYTPPLFGITCLGPSHGFDPTENTSGFIIWLNHGGIMVDPPVNSTEWLEDSNVNPKLIDSIILTHCHADHDAGTFQKILEEGKITIYTTCTILESFLRKYSALSNEPVSYLRQLFRFLPVSIGKPIYIHGGEFRMFYTLHSIPAVGFTIRFQDQSFVYSSDHQNDPGIHKKLYDEKIISEARYKELTHFPWESNLIYHESGIPPLHTPISYLNSLPDKIQKKSIIYHIAKKDFPENTNLTLARFGIENTVYLETKSPKFEKTYQILNVLKHLDFFQSFPIDKVQEFLMFVKEEKFDKGTYVIHKDTKGDRFFIIASGNVSVLYDGHKKKKTYGMYEYFGEVSLLTNNTRAVDIVAETDVVAYTIQKDHFLSFIAGTEFEETLKNLIINRDRESWELLSGSKPFRRLTTYQKTWLESVLNHDEREKPGTLIAEGENVENIYIIRKGEVEVTREGEPIALLKKGDIVGALVKLDRKLPSSYTFSNKTPVSLYSVKRKDYEKFIDRNPGLIMKLAYNFEVT
ncbi:MAG: cAMP/cGMP-dependent 3',5'-cyclic-AMP/GMP phosphodiesterase [Spirochaetales bacterium]|nr:cAMP/cGMP-dependent 3',5'-cyclic-AMP/GMP phosphodiesterase [Spirochaetales bacterium]